MALAAGVRNFTMKTLAIKFCAVTVIGAMLGVAFAASVSPDSPPSSFEAQLIEASSSTEVLIRATGKGRDVAEAIEDAKKAAVWFVVFGGESPLVETKNKAKFDEKQKEFWRNSGTYIRYASDIKGKRQVGSSTLVDLVIKVDRDGIKNTLVSYGLVADSAQVNDQLGLPSIVIQTNSKTLTSVLSSALRKSDFNLLSEEAGAKQQGLMKQLTALEGVVDPAFELAVATGADVYVKAQVDIQENAVAGVRVRKASVTLSAYDTATTQELASATGYSADRMTGPNEVTEEAAQDAAMKLRANLVQAWDKAMSAGKIYKIYLKSDVALTEDQEDAFVATLKSLKQPKMKRDKAGANIISYWLWSKSYADAYELYSDLKTAYSGPGKLSKTMESGRLLVVTVSNAGGGMTIQ